MQSLNRLILLLALCAPLGLPEPAEAAPCSLAGLRWLAGDWRTESTDSVSEERWVVAPGDRLMGSAWDIHPDRGGGMVETETIQVDGQSGVALRVRHFTAALDQAWEEKAAPMTFEAADCGPGLVIFDGAGEHVGERITYRRTEGTLTFTGDFLHQGRPVQVVINFTLRTG